MGQERTIFRPGKGMVIQSYTAAVASEAMYPADWVIMNTLIPTSQGASGVFEGKTLGAFDYIECALAVISGKLGVGSLVLGVVMGKGINAVDDWEDVSGDVIADGDVVNIQNYGVHPQAAQLATGLLGDYLVPTSTAGEMANAVTATLTSDLNTVGVCLADSSAYTRATGVSNDAGPVFISRLR